MDLNQITIPSIDTARSVAFYQQLGMKLIVDALPRYARFECPVGDATFSLHQVAEVSTGAGVIIYFETKDLDVTVERLIGEGIEFEHMPIDQRYLWREARLRDPDGHQLVLYHAGVNRKYPPWRLGDTED